MPEGLEGTGTLINDPGQNFWKFGGSAGRHETRDEPGIWMMRATRFSITEEGTGMTDLAATVPINHPIAEGDNLLIAIAAVVVIGLGGSRIAGWSAVGTGSRFGTRAGADG